VAAVAEASWLTKAIGPDSLTAGWHDNGMALTPYAPVLQVPYLPQPASRRILALLALLARLRATECKIALLARVRKQKHSRASGAAAD
jgi:hypothetical protein